MKLNVLEPPQKPLYGKECNGCGICCMQEICIPLKEIMGMADPQRKIPTPCPMLEWKNGRFECGLYNTAPPKIKAKLEYSLGFGFGCDSIIGKEDRTAAIGHLMGLVKQGGEKAREGMAMLEILMKGA